MHDDEKPVAGDDVEQGPLPDEASSTMPVLGSWSKKLLRWGVEERGVVPVPVQLRTDKQYFKIFFVWFTCNFNVLSFSAGTLGPVVFGLGVRDSCLCILFFNLLCCAPPAYLSTWGPKLGMRQMVQARYCFGYYGVILPCIFNLIGMCGFSILNCIVGGQTLAAAGNGTLSWTVGIVIIVLVSLLVSFCGYKVLNWYERLAWIPVLLVFLVALGLGGKHISNVTPAEPATAPAILTFGSTIAGFVITFSSLGSDFTTYYRPEVSSTRMFIYSYLGLLTPIVTLQCLGAAVSASAASVPDWESGFENGNVGGLINAMLNPVGGFGQFLTVLLCLSLIGCVALTFYSISYNFQILIPVLSTVPRYGFSILATAIILPLSIVGSHKFYETLLNFLSIIGYWAGAYVAIVVLEHLYFRRNDPSMYDITTWNFPGRLPWGIAALGAGIASVGLIVPCMEQIWFTGPIAKHTGDIGFEVAFGVAGILYVPLRTFEIKKMGRL